MRIITTKKGRHEVDFAWAPTFDGTCMIQYADTRRLPLVAAEWDGLESIHFTDEEAEQEYNWEGYSRLTQISIPQPGKVQIILARGVADA